MSADPLPRYEVQCLYAGNDVLVERGWDDIPVYVIIDLHADPEKENVVVQSYVGPGAAKAAQAACNTRNAFPVG